MDSLSTAQIDRELLLICKVNDFKGQPESLVNFLIEGDKPHHIYRLRHLGFNFKEFAENVWLHRLATRGNALFLKVLVDCNADVDALEWNETPLNIAVEKGHSEAVEILLACGADVNQLSCGNRDALHEVRGHDETPTKYSYRFDFKERETLTPEQVDHELNLITKINGFKGEPEGLVNFLIEGDKPHHIYRLWHLGFNIKKFAERGSWLHRLATRGDALFLKVLVDCNADVDTLKSRSRTPLNLTAEKGYTEAVEILLACRADVNRVHCGSAALHEAAEQGNSEVVRILIENRADLDIKDSDGQSAFRLALQNDHPDVMLQLKEGGADINLDCPWPCFDPEPCSWSNLDVAICSLSDDAASLLYEWGDRLQEPEYYRSKKIIEKGGYPNIKRILERSGSLG